MTTEIDPRLKLLQVERIKRHVFDGLPEYSCSQPTGVFPGKAWKCDINAYNPAYRGKGRCWVICEYVSAGPNHCNTELRAPEIIEPVAVIEYMDPVQSPPDRDFHARVESLLLESALMLCATKQILKV